MNLNPRKMQKMMKRMGIQQKDIDATEVIIKTEDKELIFKEPQVAKVNMMGQETYQVIGNPQEKEIETEPDITEDDIKTVAEQASCSKEKAQEALEENDGDLAQAILSLKRD